MKETEKRILQAATKLFSEYGYANTSTKKIADTAGVNELTIFRQFKSKSNLLQAVIHHHAFEGYIVDKISHEMKKRQSETGLASLCIGGGMGSAILVKRV